MKYAIFDMDGTLIDSMWIWENFDAELLAKYGQTSTPEIKEMIKHLSSRGTVNLFRKLFNLESSENDMLAEIASMCKDKYANQVMLKPHVLEYLQQLQKDNVRMCIATASTRESVVSALSRLEILDYFEFAMTSDDVKTGKEDPEIFLKCAERFGAEPKDIVVFDDAIHAIITAKTAGFKVIGVHDPSAEGSFDEIKALSDMFINNFSEM